MPNDERELFVNYTLMYQTGKGIDHLVPVIVPPDIMPALIKLADSEVRVICNIHKENEYLFPSNQQSTGHVSGWHAISHVCEIADVQTQSMTAAKMHHFTSTMYANLDVPEAKRHAFYRHMGHSQNIKTRQCIRRLWLRLKSGKLVLHLHSLVCHSHLYYDVM